MSTNNLFLIAVSVLAIVVFFAIRNRRDANKMMASNKDVVPLMLQKATQIKVSRLHEATRTNPRDNEQLTKLMSAYKSNRLNIHDYNEKLDKMIFRLDIEL
jgi:hypothetical protein